MKKYFYTLLAAGMLFACSQEDVVDVAKGEGQMKTITVELPSIESRAIADGVNVGEGNMVDKLIYAMYEEDQRESSPLVAKFANRQADGTFKINVTMAKNIKYDLLFLAYNEANPAFVINTEDAKVNNLNELKLNTSALKANQESYDAFVGMLDSHDINGANTVTLTRPFAQVNAVTTLADLKAVEELQSEVTSSKLVISAPDTYDVFNGVASNKVPLTYATADIIKDITLANDATAYPKNEKFGTGHYYLTLAYVLAGEGPNATASTHDAKFEFYRQDGKLVSEFAIVSLPLQRNYRTNVMGDLLTKSGDYTITIDAGFGDKDIVVDETGAKVVGTEADLKAAIEGAGEGTVIKLGDDITLTETLTLPAGIIFNGNGKQINGTISAGGNLTFVGDTKVTAFSAGSNKIININEGGCLEITGTGRVTLGYGNTFNIIGSIENAKTTDKADIQPSLIIPGGISITGGNGAVFNVTNAYVQIGNTSSKNSAANGTFTLNITNSIAEFTNQFTLSEPTGGNNPTFNMNVANSVLITATKLCVAAPNSNIVVDNSTVTLGSYLRNSGTITLKNGSVLTGKTIQFGENGGNNGTITVNESKLTITAGNTGHAFDGKDTGKITLTNNAEGNVDYYKAMTIECDATSTFTGTKVD